MPVTQTVSHISFVHNANYGAAAHRVIDAIRCTCGHAVTGFVQPALMYGRTDTFQIHCTNPACQHNRHTMEIPQWFRVVWRETWGLGEVA